MTRQAVAEKLAIIMYRDNYESALEPILKYLKDEHVEPIDRYITRLYNRNELYPYSTRELIYRDEIPNGVDGSISKEGILTRMMTMTSKDIGDVLPDNGRVLPFHPEIEGYFPYNALYVPGFDDLKKMLAGITPGDGYIIVNGDYDVDGVVSQSIAVNCLSKLGYKIKSIPNERVNGNGYNKTTHEQVKNLIENMPGCKALIMTDHGSGVEDIERLSEINNDYKVPVAVLDHHKVSGPTKNFVTAFINSRESEYKELCAGALVWQAMLYIDVDVDTMGELLPFAAITLITDVMDMSVWYTNMMYRTGIATGRIYPTQVLTMFLRSLRGNNPLSEDVIGFNIGPILNAGHRMNNAKKSVELLIAPTTLREYKEQLEDSGMSGNELRDKYIKAVLREVKGNYNDLVNLNKMRKMKSNRAMTNGLAVYPEYKKKYKFGAVLVLDKTDENVIGIVSSSIGNTYKEPTITFTKVGNLYVGSGRSIIKGLDGELICSTIKKERPDIVLGGGGHPEAFGLRVALDKIEEFKQLFSDMLGEHANEDGVLVGEEIPYTPYPLGVSNKKILDDLLNHEPYGKNDKPHYSLIGEITKEVFGVTQMHMKLTVNGKKALFFNGVNEFEDGKEYVGMVVTISPDTFNGGMQLVVDRLIEKEK